jgi:hypothetical protein
MLAQGRHSPTIYAANATTVPPNWHESPPVKSPAETYPYEIGLLGRVPRGTAQLCGRPMTKEAPWGTLFEPLRRLVSIVTLTSVCTMVRNLARARAL